MATRLASFPYFLSEWVPMMAAMMLPGTATAALQQAHSTLRARDVPSYVASYFGVWALIGVAVFALYRPQRDVGSWRLHTGRRAYERTPTKRRFRWMCRERVPSGFRCGLCCLGSSIGLVLMAVVLGVMSVIWRAVVARIVLVQKVLPPRAAVNIPLALAIVALGVVILAAPSAVPGLVPLMHTKP